MLQFDLLCSAAESEALRNVPDIDLMHEVTAMGLRTYMVDIESARRGRHSGQDFLNDAGEISALSQ